MPVGDYSRLGDGQFLDRNGVANGRGGVWELSNIQTSLDFLEESGGSTTVCARKEEDSKRERRFGVTQQISFVRRRGLETAAAGGKGFQDRRDRRARRFPIPPRGFVLSTVNGTARHGKECR